MASVNRKTRGLNHTQPGHAPTFDPNYKPRRYQQAQPQEIRLRICEQMRKDSPRFMKGDKFQLREWIDHYNLFINHRNDTALSAIGLMKVKTLKDWWQFIAKDDKAMDALRASIKSHQAHERKTRKRHSANRSKYGDTPFAERIFCALREMAVLENTDHGVTWGIRTMNRILDVPWIFEAVSDWIDDDEATKWKERGPIVKQNIAKMQVCTIYICWLVTVGLCWYWLIALAPTLQPWTEAARMETLGVEFGL